MSILGSIMSSVLGGRAQPAPPPPAPAPSGTAHARPYGRLFRSARTR